MTSRQVLVTGASGFIGSHLVDRLAERGDRARAMVRPTSKLDKLSEHPVELAYATLDDGDAIREAMSGCEWVFHIAGTTAAFSRGDFMAANTTGTRNVLEAAASLPEGERPRVVVVSSLMAAGPSGHQAPLLEVTRCAPNTMYGESKLEAERVALEVARDTGLEIAIVRPPLVYGPRDTDVLQIFKAASFGVVAQPGLANVELSAIYVDDLVSGLIAVAEHGETLPVATGPHAITGEGLALGDDPTPEQVTLGAGLYFLDDGATHSIASFGHACAHAQGRRALTFAMPRAAVIAVGAVNQVAARLRGEIPALTLDKARGSAVDALHCRSDKARSTLPWEPAVPLELGLSRTVLWYREHGLLAAGR